MAQHRLQLSIYCSVQENQRQALHFTLQVRRLGLCTCQNMVDQGQRLMLPSWEQHRQEVCAADALLQRDCRNDNGRAGQIWGMEPGWRVLLWTGPAIWMKVRGKWRGMTAEQLDFFQNTLSSLCLPTLPAAAAKLWPNPGE